MFSTNRRMKDNCSLEFEVDLKKSGRKGRVQQDKGIEDVAGDEWQFSTRKVIT